MKQRCLMDPQFHSTIFTEYQECVCTEMGTMDMTTVSLLLKTSSQQVMAIQILVQYAYSEKHGNKVWSQQENEMRTWGIQEGISEETELAP